MKTSPTAKAPAQPKYWRVTERIRAEIARGTLRPGDRIPSQNEMQERFKISRTTVDKVQSLLLQEGLVISEQGRGTFVAQPGAPRKTGVIGLIGPGFSATGHSDYWAELFAGVQSVAAQQGKKIRLLDAALAEKWDDIEGFLSALWPLPDALKRRHPAIFGVSLLYPIDNLASVYVDDFDGGFQAAQHLLAQGHRRIACLHSRNTLIVPKRLSGYRAALENAGVSVEPAWIRALAMPPEDYKSGLFFTRDGYATVSRWLREDWKSLGCTALLAHNDETAIGALRAFREAGLRVPQDVSLIGYDGLEIGEYISPRLTTMAIPLRQIGAAGMELLCRQLSENKSNTEHRVLPIQLRPGESTQALPVT